MKLTTVRDEIRDNPDGNLWIELENDYITYDLKLDKYLDLSSVEIQRFFDSIKNSLTQEGA